MRETILEQILELTELIEEALQKSMMEENEEIKEINDPLSSEYIDEVESLIEKRKALVFSLGDSPLPFQSKTEENLYQAIEEIETRLFAVYRDRLQQIDDQSEKMQTGKKAMAGYFSKSEELRKLRDFSGRG